MTANSDALLLHLTARTDLVDFNVAVIHHELDECFFSRREGVIPPLAPRFELVPVV